MLVACHTSRQAKGDYTRNSSRSEDEVVTKSRNKSSKKNKRTTYTSNESTSEEYLDPLSGASSSETAKENTDSKANEKHKASNAERNSLTSNLIYEADRLIGVDYRYGGTSPARGFDCSGFTSYVFDKMHIEIPRTSTDQSKAGKRKKFSDANVGDLVFFGTGNRVTHVGIVVARTSKKLEVIHSTSSSGVRRDEIFGSQYWNSRTLWAVDFESLSSK